MRSATAACTATLALGLQACAPQTMTRGDYDIGVEAMRGSSKLAERAIGDCASDWAKSTVPELRDLADLLDVREREAPRVLCERVIGAMLDGRISYEDYVAVGEGKITPEIIRILQGRSQQPDLKVLFEN